MLSLLLLVLYCSEGIWSAYLYLVYCQDLWKITGNSFSLIHSSFIWACRFIVCLTQVCSWFKLKSVCWSYDKQNLHNNNALLLWYWISSYIPRRVHWLCKVLSAVGFSWRSDGDSCWNNSSFVRWWRCKTVPLEWLAHSWSWNHDMGWCGCNVSTRILMALNAQFT